MPHDSIVIHGAREHNLKGFDLTLPRDRLIVITGLSGSGKSSLAFDTIYAEGQRRYVESLSAYARQFLGQMEKPDVDHIEGLSPAISIDQKGSGRNPRSTVGTVTEIYDYLRLLWARIGHPHCPNCGREISRQSVDQIADQVLDLPEGTRLMVTAPMVRGRKGEHREILESARRKGFVRARVDGRLRDLSEPIALDKKFKHDIEVVVDRVVIGPDIRHRVTESLEQASTLSGGIILLVPADRAEVRHHAAVAEEAHDTVDGPVHHGEGVGEMLFSQEYACVYCGISMEEPAPRNFSFNSPHGACPACTGLGVRMEVDEDAVVPDASISIMGGALSGWTRGPSQHWLMEVAQAVARDHRIPLDKPWRTLTDAQRTVILRGLPRDETVRFTYTGHTGRTHTMRVRYEGVIPNLERRYKETESEAVKADIERLMMQKPCPVCGGRRLKPEYLAVTVGGTSIADFCAQSIAAARRRVDTLELTAREATIARQVLKEIRERLGFLDDVGLDYLTLDRGAQSLSGGEAQRIRLATQIGSKLMGVLYVLDEPSIGLHQRDNAKLIATLQALRDIGNTLIVVEHDEETIRAADYVVDIGPGAGEHGGHVVAAGTLEEVLRTEGSATADFLSGRRRIPVPASRRSGSGRRIVVRGARENNLRDVDVAIPLGTLTCVSGVSGSGKSSLINDILYRRLAQVLHKAKERPGAHRAIDGLEHLDKVISVDQSPIGRTPRSNPATYVGVFTYIRELFAALPEARVRGYKPGRFSFNVSGGRCEACQGDGVIKIEMHFLPDIYVTCEVCKGRRYNREALEVRFRGHTIADVLQMTVDEAAEVFTNQPRIARKLHTLQDVGLGYIRLGQPATQLSGGEAQRVKLATELSRRDTGRTFYVLDEPTTGLHYADVERLLDVLHRLVDHGNTVVVIEHNLDVLKTADWLIDLGPEGGEQGGRLVAEGTPEAVAA
ncbi:MAG TPA: excinuclease ABC subunit UvrA, partial [Candidatus Dormibacteraeota bacterium]|nr:excinuclease ABC subunit UvrA [Candidatus Dormibacteraeota bacterium]